VRSLTFAETLATCTQPSQTDFFMSCSATVDLVEGDIIKGHDSGALSATSNQAAIRITQIAIT
jgi:hypothetical protein